MFCGLCYMGSIVLSPATYLEDPRDSQALWHTTVIPALGSLWQRDHKLEARLGCKTPSSPARDVAQFIEHLPSMNEALGSISRAT